MGRRCRILWGVNKKKRLAAFYLGHMRLVEELLLLKMMSLESVCVCARATFSVNPTVCVSSPCLCRCVFLLTIGCVETGVHCV